MSRWPTSMNGRRVLAVVAATVTASLALVTGAAARNEVFFAHLSPENVKPPGPPGGYADLALQNDDEKNVICYLARWDGIGEITGLHIHFGEPGADGPVMVDLPVPDYNKSGCTPADHAILSYLNDNPRGHYVDVHTDTHPNGAARGQVSESENRRTPRTAPPSTSPPPPPPPQPPPHGNATPTSGPTASGAAAPPGGQGQAPPPPPPPAPAETKPAPTSPPTRASAAAAPAPAPSGAPAAAPDTPAAPPASTPVVPPSSGAVPRGAAASSAERSLTPPAGPGGLASSSSGPAAAAGDASGPGASLAANENAAPALGGGDDGGGLSGALVGACIVAGLGGAGAAAYGFQRRRRQV